MSNNFLKINPGAEAGGIKNFIRNILSKEGKRNVVIGLSSGVDSTTSLYLLKMSIPLDNIYAVNLPYFEENSDLEAIFKAAGLPGKRRIIFSIKPIVDAIVNSLRIPANDIIRRGNIMARVRMIALYDFSKKLDALVCGTENKSEKLLGYFTRFGDEASDFEPIHHLYKTQVYDLAKFLGVPKSIIAKTPSANLWEDQSDEGEFGFSYKEADPVLYLYFDKKESIEKIEKLGFEKARKIIEFAKSNAYKHRTPYKI